MKLNVKSLIVFVILFWSAVSCSKEVLNGSDSERVSMSINVSAGDQSKTILSEGCKVCWMNTDALLVFGDNGEGVSFTTSIDQPSEKANFHTSDWPSNVTPVFATFCDSEIFSECLCSPSESLITTCVSDRQTILDNSSFARNANASVGRVVMQGDSFFIPEMKNIVGLLKLSFTGTNEIESIDVESIGGEPVAGWVNVDFSKLDTGDADFWTNSETKTQSGKITLVPGNGDAYVAILPQTYTQGLRFILTDTEGRKAERTVGKNGGLVVSRGEIKTFKTAIDDGLTFVSAELPETLSFTICGTGWNLTPECLATTSQKGTGDSYIYSYTDDETGYSASYEFVICKGSDSIEGAQYTFAKSNNTIKFAKSGSWIKAPAINGRVLESVIVASGTSGARSISITKDSHTGEEIMASTPVPANGQLNKTFTSDDSPKTEPGTAYCVNMKNGTSTWKSITFVYSKALKKKETPTNQIRILGIGNSWTRDSFRYIYGICESAGITPIVAHAYLGGSGLDDQYYGMDDENYTYNHSGTAQKVHSTYQYWLYEGTVDPQLTPSETEYGNGLKGTGVTLESILKDKPWDIIIFQTQASSIVDWESYVGRTVKDENSFTIARLVNKVKNVLPQDVAAKVKVGIMCPWSYAFGYSGHSSVIYSWSHSPQPTTQREWDIALDKYHVGLQAFTYDLSLNMGCPCDYYVNVGKAIYFGRQDEILSKCGFKLQRAEDNTHLSEGVSKYLASLMFAYEIFGLKPEQISFNPSSYDFTADRITAAKNQSWAAWTGDNAPEVGRVVTSNPSLDGTTLHMSGSFNGKYASSAADFTCGFEYKTGEGEWQSVPADVNFYDFDCSVNGISTDSNITVRAWAASEKSKVYGEEKSLGTPVTDQLVLTPTTEDFQNQGDGMPGPKRYEVGVDQDPGQAAFADKEFIYTHPETGNQYPFVFYGKGPYLYSSSRYYVYYCVTGKEFMFGSAGSYIKLPAIPDKKLVSVTLSSSNSKSIGIASSKENVSSSKCISGGSKRTSGYEFHLDGTSVNTSYYVFTGSSGAKLQFVSIVYE